MIQKIDDIYIDYKRKTIEQKLNLKAFSISMGVLGLIVLINLLVYYYAIEYKKFLILFDILTIVPVLLLTPQFIGNSKIIVKSNVIIIKKKYLLGLYIKEIEVEKESVKLAKIISKEYDDFGKETGELIRYWIVSAGYRNFKIMRLRKPENIDVLKKSLSSILEKETMCNTIVVKKNESNTFIS